MTNYKEKIYGSVSQQDYSVTYNSFNTYNKRKINEKIIIKTSGFFNWSILVNTDTSITGKYLTISILLCDEDGNKAYYPVAWENVNVAKELEVLISEFGEYKYFYGFCVTCYIAASGIRYFRLLPSNFEINIEVY